MDVYFNQCTQRFHDKSDQSRGIWTRAKEHVWKLAMLYACSGFDPSSDARLVIDEDAATWAIRFTDWSLARTRYELFFKISGNDFESRCNKVIEFLHQSDVHQFPVRTLPGKALPKVPNRARREVIESLLASGEIVERVSDNGKPGRPPRVYALNVREAG